ncbi:hypothetical protein [Achromobacter kerstersii]|uniref:Uncharacterized protein n=1 Tax=Achromobacter kerstersii TaxID=1353890 RepID=A0A6S7AJJ9_9BURK|nr:hypothetical protein [Achromobacter kerstersii]CAB3730722.1 hypothetical protein LMG3441_04642 [Achromobacter kerstersii]CUJ59086.1 Uncharacterised protein [Achromobacter kerstersii]
MMNAQTKRVMEVVAAAEDGTTYRINRYCRSEPDQPADPHYFCCLQDGQLVSWRGDGNYELPDGTIVTTVATRLCQ